MFQTSEFPVTVQPGFLGTARTAVFSHILSNQQDKKVAVMMASLSETSTDSAIVQNKIFLTVAKKSSWIRYE